MKASVVIGANFGDEGKGLMVDYLSNGSRPVVVRFNGGGQAGHTVVTPDGKRHVFQHIGASYFATNNPATYLSKYFVVNPFVYWKEFDKLKETGMISYPMIYIDQNALLTTPFDIHVNQLIEHSRGNKRHGSCGIGINETVKRSFTEFKTQASDMMFPTELRQKLHQIHSNYVPLRLKELGLDSLIDTYLKTTKASDWIEEFIEQCSDMVETCVITTDINYIHHIYDHFVFEGAQGLLLDEDHYWFPHVTRSKTGLHNALRLIEELGMDSADVYYMTRCYLTRHGAGPLPYELSEPPYAMIKDETNIENQFQGKLRFAPLNVQLLNESIGDDLDQKTTVKLNPKLMVTCMDQSPLYRIIDMNGDHQILGENELIKYLKNNVPVNGIGIAKGPTRQHVYLYHLLG